MPSKTRIILVQSCADCKERIINLCLALQRKHGWDPVIEITKSNEIKDNCPLTLKSSIDLISAPLAAKVLDYFDKYRKHFNKSVRNYYNDFKTVNDCINYMFHWTRDKKVKRT